MQRRAIVIVPGFGRLEHHQARDQLVLSLRYYGEGWDVREIEDADTVPEGAVSLSATARNGGESRIIDVFEAHWGDLVPDWSQESPWKRFKRGFVLIWYWLFGGFFAASKQGLNTPRTTVAMGVAALLLLLWWMAVAVFLLQAVSEGGVDLPAWVSALAEAEDSSAPPDTPTDALAPSMPQHTPRAEGAPANMSEQADADAATRTAQDGWSLAKVLDALPGILGSVAVGALLWLWNFGVLEQFANTAASVKAYLRDEVFGENGIGIRAKSRIRVRAVLDQLTLGEGPGEYSEIYVVGHSVGGAIALDALAECGDKLSGVVLFTWGSALGLLTQQEQLVEREIYKLYTAEPRIRNWIDVVIRRDFMASKVPVPREFSAFGGEPGAQVEPIFPDPVEPKIPYGLSNPAKLHEAYYRCEEAAVLLLETVENLPKRAPGA
ncbi:alpha/beta hydrolase [Salipiger abyssi]|uniref:alpha/beta hydrolase n=1 Tax=Salipiger abyssi TaxID=1250539 RepID=UPI001A903CA2|nr:alpha/beta hydrolase [Salipiger abyssi]MBN9888510.1 alpha/beta hydrolase [Salipiger abyssi]